MPSGMAAPRYRPDRGWTDHCYESEEARGSGGRFGLGSDLQTQRYIRTNICNDFCSKTFAFLAPPRTQMWNCQHTGWHSFESNLFRPGMGAGTCEALLPDCLRPMPAPRSPPPRWCE